MTFETESLRDCFGKSMFWMKAGIFKTLKRKILLKEWIERDGNFVFRDYYHKNYLKLEIQKNN